MYIYIYEYIYIYMTNRDQRCGKPIVSLGK